MANEPKDGLKRRDFMMAAIALVGGPTAGIHLLQHHAVGEPSRLRRAS
jgi:hypothetical protein